MLGSTSDTVFASVTKFAACYFPALFGIEVSLEEYSYLDSPGEDFRRYFRVLQFDSGYRVYGGSGKKISHFQRAGGPRIPMSGTVCAQRLVRQRIHVLQLRYFTLKPGLYFMSPFLFDSQLFVVQVLPVKNFFGLRWLTAVSHRGLGDAGSHPNSLHALCVMSEPAPPHTTTTTSTIERRSSVTVLHVVLVVDSQRETFQWMFLA